MCSVAPGELPPPPPSACFGRDALIEEIVGLAENLEPFALIGAGGIGKTSIALAVLHDQRIKDRFGDNRRFLRCDRFPASRLNFLARLSKAIGASVDNPEDLAPLQPFLSSKVMILFLDNAESILDPQGTDAREIYALVGELTRFDNICLGITSRIYTVPPKCKRPVIPTLSIEPACQIFYGIYGSGGESPVVNDLVRRLDFHALSITLLATTASHNVWNYDRLTKEWETRRVQVLRTEFNESLAATIELSLTSPTFSKLGSDARELLGVIAFFPQGVDENNLDWLFPTIVNGGDIFDKFCALSLTHRSNGFVTMLAPIRDYLSPKHPTSSPFLCATKDHYFRRLSVPVDARERGFTKARWIISEDANVEHLLDVFTSIDGTPNDVWDACGHFMGHLYWHKPRQTMLGPRTEGLPDDHPSKPECLFQLSRLFNRVGNHAEQKRLLTHALKLERGRGSNPRIVQTLRFLSDANRFLGLYGEGIEQAREASKIMERLGDTIGNAACLVELADLLLSDNQIDAAQETASRTIDLVSGKGEELVICRSHRILGETYRSKGDKVKAIHHFETAIRIASPLGFHNQVFWTQYKLAALFFNEGELDNAQVHIEQSKSYAVTEKHLGGAMSMLARIWFLQKRLEDARSEILRAREVHKKFGSRKDLEDSEALLREIELAMSSRSTSGGHRSGGELLGLHSSFSY